MFVPFSKRAKEWEPLAVELREIAGVDAAGILDPWLLAGEVGLTVVDAAPLIERLAPEHRRHLLGSGCRKWSGGVDPRCLADGTRICILNPTHSRRRNKITLMEEIAHTHLRHEPTGLLTTSEQVDVRDYNKMQEQEAYGVGAAALIPWSTFFPAVNAGYSAEELAERYDVTQALILYRLKITAAYRVYQARQRRKA